MPKNAKPPTKTPRAQNKKSAPGDMPPKSPALFSEFFSALQGPARATISAEDVLHPSIATLVEALTIRQRLLADQLKAAQGIPNTDVASHARVALAVGRAETSIANELGALAEPERQLFIESLLDQLARLSPPLAKHHLPDAAPEEWEKRKAGLENPPQFVRRVYAAWIGKGLTRALIRQLDLPLYRALAAWMSRHPEDDFSDLPSLSDSIDQKVARLSAEFTPDELRRLGLALQNRARRL